MIVNKMLRLAELDLKISSRKTRRAEGSLPRSRCRAIERSSPAAPRSAIAAVFLCSSSTNARMAALELSIDKDWMRYKVSGFYQSGDGDPGDGKGRGFDSIFDNVNFAGGPFSFFVHQGIRLTQTAVGLTQRGSLLAVGQLRLRVAADAHDRAADALARHLQAVVETKDRIAELEERATRLVEADPSLSGFTPPRSGHKDWLTVELPGL